MTYETEQYKGLTIRLEHDQDCTSRLDWDVDLCITYRKGAREGYGNTPLDQEEHEAIARRIGSGELIGLPVYVYSHGGVSIKAADDNPFSCPWDSGQSGYVYVTKRTALDWQGGKILTAKRRASVLASLRSCVDEYSKWCNGECYGYIIEDAEGEELGSCWGFIGYEYAMDCAHEAADYCAKEQLREKGIAWRGALHEARERKVWACRGVVTV